MEITAITTEQELWDAKYMFSNVLGVLRIFLKGRLKGNIQLSDRIEPQE
jgi:hypothetical protein